MSDQSTNENEPLQPGQSFRSHHHDQIQQPGKLVRVLNDTQPAKLLIWSAVLIIIAALSGITRIYLNTGMSFNDAQQFYENGTGSVSYITDFAKQNDRTGIVRIKSLFALLLGGVAFFTGVAGGLLPMWAVGRLISDTIREGYQHD